jgi:hypothetical protein
LADAAGFLSPSKSFAANSEDLSVSSTVGLNFGNCWRTFTQIEEECVALCVPVVVCYNLLDLLFGVDSRRGTLIDLLEVLVVDIHLLLDHALESVLQGL